MLKIIVVTSFPLSNNGTTFMKARYSQINNWSLHEHMWRQNNEPKIEMSANIHISGKMAKAGQISSSTPRVSRNVSIRVNEEDLVSVQASSLFHGLPAR